jgi:hypothetical protein
MPLLSSALIEGGTQRHQNDMLFTYSVHAMKAYGGGGITPLILQPGVSGLVCNAALRPATTE